MALVHGYRHWHCSKNWTHGTTSAIEGTRIDKTCYETDDCGLQMKEYTRESKAATSVQCSLVGCTNVATYVLRFRCSKHTSNTTACYSCSTHAANSNVSFVKITCYEQVPCGGTYSVRDTCQTVNYPCSHQKNYSHYYCDHNYNGVQHD